MDHPDQLRAERANVIAKMKALTEAPTKRNELAMSDAETAEFTKLEGTVNALDQTIKASERALALQQDLNRAPEPAIRPMPNAGPAPEDRKTGIRGIAEFLYLARYKKDDPRIVALTTTTGEGGRYAIPPTFDPTPKELEQEGAIIRPRSMPWPVDPERPDADMYVPALDQGTASQNMFGGAQVAYRAETAAGPTGDLKLRQVHLKPKEIKGIIEPPNTLLRNWAAAEPTIRRMYNSALVGFEETKFFSGDGVVGARGIINVSCRLDHARAAANQLSYADTMGMLQKARKGMSLFWLASDDLLTQLLSLEDNLGNLIFKEKATDDVPDRLHGKPVLWSERSPNLGTRGDLVLCDLSYYLVTAGYPMSIELSEHEKFSQGITVIRLLGGHDADAWLKDPITHEGGRQRSPFVVLGDPAG